MSEIGEVLRKAREEKGLRLVDVQEKTMIRTKYLKAMEEDDYSSLPEDVYARGFLRSYARFLGVDPGPLLEEYDRRKALRSPEGHRLSEKSVAPPASILTGKVARKGGPTKQAMEAGTTGRRGSRLPAGRRRAFAVLCTLVVVTLFLVAVIAVPALFYPWNASVPVGNGDTHEPPATGGGHPSAGPLTGRAGSESAREGVEVTTPPTTGPPVAEREVKLAEHQDNRIVYRVSGGNGLEISVRTVSKCWIQAEADGRVLASETLEQGTVRTWKGRDELHLWIGYPAGVTIESDGRPIKPPGDLNRPIHLYLRMEKRSG